ncbi:Coiled-coil-helix-coiled-coil-helix domain-containing protein 5 [Neolecta irregularis DAH-3]|uniref:Coiled-coil-helix-coiled-coil-helix domain-containing protein 5 n=1 Tax=Neolecta irregularis (strain DAH-3) TaxID=1198029 RepID=A0A1U7LMC8_NEOID|nr:Coiled-coil-helix-coiled-coil-helix domain-containing protein 5 [Neolecta irregularis DAH-3]|eukprot:OLL23743.1 Coiled-coil-helix-coiled-coil-helix domain-containing protein 5 [Neolecta irregularis DAH-3]
MSSSEVISEVLAKCASQVQTYNQCITDNPHNWNKACLDERAAVTECAEEKVAILKKVKTDCASEIAAFNKCLEENSSELNSCIPVQRELYNCTAKSAGRKLPPFPPS